MSRYATRPNGNSVLIIDTTTGHTVCTSGNTREAATFLRALNKATDGTPKNRPHRLNALTSKALGVLCLNKGSHPDIIAARTAARSATTARTAARSATTAPIAVAAP